MTMVQMQHVGDPDGEEFIGGDGLGFAWIAAIPGILSALSSNKGEGGGEGGEKKGGGGGGFDFASIIGKLLPGAGGLPDPLNIHGRQGGAAAKPAAPSFVFCPPGLYANPTWAAIPVEQRAQAAQAGIQACIPAGGGAGMTPGTGSTLAPARDARCPTSELWSFKYNLCFDPNTFANETEAYNSSVAKGTAGGIAATPAVAAATRARRTAAVKRAAGSRAKSRRHRMNGLGGWADTVDLTPVSDALNEAAMGTGFTAILLAVSGALIGIGAAIGYSRSSHARPMMMTHMMGAPRPRRKAPKRRRRVYTTS